MHGSRLRYCGLGYFTRSTGFIREFTHARKRAFGNLFCHLCAQCCATDTPIGDALLRGAGDAKRLRVSKRLCAYAKLGATDDEIVVELPGNVPSCLTDVAVSSNAAPVAYCEREWADSCERVVSLLPVGDDIVTFAHSIHFNTLLLLERIRVGLPQN